MDKFLSTGFLGKEVFFSTGFLGGIFPYISRVKKGFPQIPQPIILILKYILYSFYIKNILFCERKFYHEIRL